MSAPSIDSPARSGSATIAAGVGLGLLIGFTFALVIRLVPDSVLTETGPRILAYVVLAVTAPTIVLPLWELAARLRVDPRRLSWGAISGALLFDGVALGFAPELYAKSGDAWAYTAAGLLWAFGWIALTQLLVEQRRP